jgi:hypothetical protein
MDITPDLRILIRPEHATDLILVPLKGRTPVAVAEMNETSVTVHEPRPYQGPIDGVDPLPEALLEGKTVGGALVDPATIPGPLNGPWERFLQSVIAQLNLMVAKEVASPLPAQSQIRQASQVFAQAAQQAGSMASAGNLAQAVQQAGQTLAGGPASQTPSGASAAGAGLPAQSQGGITVTLGADNKMRPVKPVELHYVTAHTVAGLTGKADLLLLPEEAGPQAPAIKIGEMQGNAVALSKPVALPAVPPRTVPIDPYDGYNLTFTDPNGAATEDPASAIQSLLEAELGNILGWDPDAVTLDEELAEDGDLGFCVYGGNHPNAPNGAGGVGPYGGPGQPAQQPDPEEEDIPPLPEAMQDLAAVAADPDARKLLGKIPGLKDALTEITGFTEPAEPAPKREEADPDSIKGRFGDWG